MQSYTPEEARNEENIGNLNLNNKNNLLKNILGTEQDKTKENESNIIEPQSDNHENTTTNKRKDQYNVKRIKDIIRKNNNKDMKSYTPEEARNEDNKGNLNLNNKNNHLKNILVT